MQQLQGQGRGFFFIFLRNALIPLQIVSETVSVPSVYIISACRQLVSIIQHFHNLIARYILQIHIAER